MKIFRPFAFLAFFFALLSCAPNPRGPIVSTPQTTSNPSNSLEQDVLSMPMEAPHLDLPSDRRLLSAESVSLDQTAVEEQILFLQSTTNLSLPIEIRVINYDQGRKTYYLAWEGTTLASANQPFTYEFQDLVGDHTKALLIRGIDDQGRPTLDIFRQTVLPGGHGFQLKRIFSLALKGTITVTQSARSNGYDSGQNSDISFPIVTEQADPASANGLGIVRDTYEFRFQSGDYLKAKTEEVTTDRQNDSSLQGLFAGDTKGFETFLKGPWLKVETTESGLHPMIFFDPQTKEMTFATDKAQEVYQWEVMSRTMRNGLYIVGNNQLIGLITVQLTLTVTSADSLEINVQDTPSWSGTYHRMPEGLLEASLRAKSLPLPQQEGLSGVYRDEKGNEIRFELPLVTWSLGATKIVNAASLFDWDGRSFLQLKPVNTKTNKPSETRTFLFQKTEEKTTSRIIRNLTLQPGDLTVEGWISDRSEPWRLEQIEVLSEIQR